MRRSGFFGWFNRRFTRTAKSYEGFVGSLLRRTGRALVVFAGVIGVVALLFTRMPYVLPAERRPGLHHRQHPAAAWRQPGTHQQVMQQAEGFIMKQPEVANMVSVLGFSFSGQGQNVALAFIR